MWDEKRHRRGWKAADKTWRRRGDPDALVAAHAALKQIDEYEYGFREYVLGVLIGTDAVAAARFLLRTMVPERAWRRLVSIERAGAWWVFDPPDVTLVRDRAVAVVDLAKRDYWLDLDHFG